MRRLSSLIILSLCVVTAVEGWRITGFAEARARVAAGAAPVDTLRRWVGIPGLSGPALQAALARAPIDDTQAGLQARSDELAHLLVVRPLASADWLSLAAVRLEAGKPDAEVERALTMSWLSGPNEAAVMWQRVVFGILHWETLSPEAHERIVTDLAGSVTGATVSGEDLSLAGHLLGRQTVATRAAIAARLRAAGVAEPALARLGLPGEGG